MDFSVIALIAGLVLSMGLGMLWYHPKSPTGAIWAEGVGLADVPAGAPPVLPMIANTVGLILVGILVGLSGALTGYLAALAFGVMQISGGLFARVKPGVMLVHLGYWLSVVTLMALVQHLL